MRIVALITAGKVFESPRVGVSVRFPASSNLSVAWAI
jgi:hypothetical protein